MLPIQNHWSESMTTEFWITLLIIIVFLQNLHAVFLQHKLKEMQEIVFELSAYIEAEETR